MGKNVNVILATVLVFLVVADVSSAWSFRKLVASPPKQHNNSSDSPISSPKLPGKQLSPVGKDKKIEPSPASTTEEDSSKDKKVTTDTNLRLPPINVKDYKDNSTDKGAVKHKEESEAKEGEKDEENEKAEEKEEQKEEQREKEKEKDELKKEQKEKDNDNGESETTVPDGGGESCDAMGRRCQDSKSMTACIKSVDHDSKSLVLLIQNKGYNGLKVNITALSSGYKQQVVNIPKLQSKQVNMPLADARINEITLTAGNGFCVLHLGTPVSQRNFFRWMPSYSKFVTPIYGAYLILAVTLVAGGVWACCWFTKRKGHREIPYQELEMSRPDSAVAVETTEGWDEVWDDDWDEENAVRSPGGHSISANDLTSRNAKKGDWEDWDD